MTSLERIMCPIQRGNSRVGDKGLTLTSGQAGLNLGARLQSLGLTALIIDKNNRVGDNWRNRYRVSHHDSLSYNKSLPSPDSCDTRPGRIHASSLSPVPQELATVYAKGQAG